MPWMAIGILACYFIHSDRGAVEFNKELARMTFWKVKKYKKEGLK
jgi:hypothetical protein